MKTTEAKKTETPEHEKFSKLFNWVARSKELSAFEKLLYTRIHGHLGEHAQAWPGMRRLAEELGASKSQVSRGLQTLERLKLLTVFRTSKLGPDGGVNHYSFTDHPMKYTKREVSPRQDHGVPPGVHQCPLGRTTGVPPAGTEETHTRDSCEENKEEINSEKVSLRSTFWDGGSVTKECFATDEGLSQDLNYAADSVALPQPPVPGIVSQAAPEFVVGDPLMEDGMSDEERKRRMESARMQAQMAEHRHDVVRVAKEIKQKTKAKRAVALGELPKLPVPKPKLGGILLGMQDLWVGEYRRKFPNDSVASSWTVKEGAQIKSLIDRYSVEEVERTIRYLIRYWEAHQPRFFKGANQGPTLGALCTLHETLFFESGRMFTALKAKADYEAWAKANPDEVMPPEDLQKAYNAALPALKSLKL